MAARKRRKWWSKWYVERNRSTKKKHSRQRRREIVAAEVKRLEELRLRAAIRKAQKPPRKPPSAKPPRPRREDVCIRGHAWTEENTYIIPSGPKQGFRQCRECKRLRESERYARLTAAREAALQAKLREEMEARRRWLLRPPARGVSDGD